MPMLATKLSHKTLRQILLKENPALHALREINNDTRNMSN